MTTALMQYGSFQRPEERKQIQVNQDFHELVTAAFRQWLPVVDSLPDLDTIDTIEHGQADILYEEAAHLLTASTPIEQVSSGLESVVAEITTLHHRAGIFVSAMHNLSGQRTLEGNFKTPIIGYRIAPGKELVLLNESSALSVGDFGQGKIVNFATLSKSGNFGFNALGGLYANFGILPDMGNMAEGGLFVNFNMADEMGENANQGVFVNLGRAEYLGYMAKGGLYVTRGNVEKVCRLSVNAVSLKLGDLTILGAHSHNSRKDIILSDVPPITEYSDKAKGRDQLIKTVHEIDNLCRIIVNGRVLNNWDILKAIEAYDWQGTQATLKAQLNETGLKQFEDLR